MFDKYETNAREVSGYRLQRTDPHGFWIILDGKGKPVPGQGEFTSVRDANNALQAIVDKAVKKDKKI